MKSTIKNLSTSFILLISISACNNTITRLWNSGPYISPAERKASQDCSQEYLKINPGPSEPITRNQEWLEYNAEAERWISQCKRNKGF